MQEKLTKVTKILNYIKSSYHSEMFQYPQIKYYWNTLKNDLPTLSVTNKSSIINFINFVREGNKTKIAPGNVSLAYYTQPLTGI